MTWRNGVAMATLDTQATDIVATMVTLMEVITEEDTIIPTTGLITVAIMAIHMVAITAGIMAEDSGLASVSKTE